MISRKLYFKIIVYVVSIAALCIAMGFLVTGRNSLRIVVLCIAAIIILTASLISFLNRTNRSIRFFFETVRNDETGLSFQSAVSDETLKELYSSMNKVNRHIQELKIQNRRQEQYFQSILEHLATGIVTYDNKGFIQHANTSAKHLLSLETFTHLRQLEKTDKKLYSVISSLKAGERKLLGINSANGEIQLALKTTSYGSDDKKLMILSVQDIKHELDEKEIDSWMKLIRVLMHEIMNSITPITSLSESLSGIYKTGGKPVEPARINEKTISTTLQGLEVIRDQGRGLMSFVENYRKLTHIPRPEKKHVPVNDIFTRVKILTSSPEKGKNTQIIFGDTESDLVIYADENLVSLVLINLIKNALEANAENNVAIIRIKGQKVDNQVEISVTDNGPGINPDILDKIFIPFFTTRKNGSGIGLSLSRQIMNAHGGTLKVRSEPGKETVFCMSFITFAG